MRLDFTRRQWNRLAELDPYWAVLTAPDKKGNQWKREEFFAQGRAEVEASLAVVRRHFPTLRTGAALDFGCGVGRLTQGLAGTFDRVTGIDLSEQMLALARRHNRHGDRVRYLHNTRPDLRILDRDQYDFVFSLITLQHLKPGYARRYIAEFVRVAAPGGAIFFQLPATRPPPPAPRPFTLWPDTLVRRVIRDVRCRLGLDFPRMEMHAVPRPVVESALRAAGAEILHVYRHDAAGADVESWNYLARKP